LDFFSYRSEPAGRRVHAVQGDTAKARAAYRDFCSETFVTQP